MRRPLLLLVTCAALAVALAGCPFFTRGGPPHEASPAGEATDPPTPAEGE